MSQNFDLPIYHPPLLVRDCGMVVKVIQNMELEKLELNFENLIPSIFQK